MLSRRDQLLILMNPLLSRPAAAAAAGWWTVAGKTCVAAYQPIGAASLAASYSNLANPGTYDASPGTAPTFDAENGWTYSGEHNGMGIGSPITGTGARTIIVRYNSDNTNSAGMVALYGSDADDTAGAYFTFTPEIAVRVSDGNILWSSEGTTSEVVACITGPSAGSTTDLTLYINGSAVSAADSSSAQAYDTKGPGSIADGALAGSADYSGVISAIAIYSGELSAGEVASLSTAMAALS